MKSPRMLDYAVYDNNLIVSLLLTDQDGFMQAVDDSENGRCEIVSCPRKRVSKSKKEVTNKAIRK